MGFPHGHRKPPHWSPGGLRPSGMVTPMVLEGAINGDWLDAYVAHVLVSELRHGDVVIMDNLFSHKRIATRERIQAAGTALLFLPPLQRGLQPHQKGLLPPQAMPRKAGARTVSGLCVLISQLVGIFQPREFANHFSSCGMMTTDRKTLQRSMRPVT